MSNLPDRRNSPRRHRVERGGNILAVRVAVLLYTPLVLTVFAANGDWRAFLILMSMLWYVFRPLPRRIRL
jgi:hypothetical protein